MTSAHFTLPDTTALLFQPVVTTGGDSWSGGGGSALLGRQCAAPWRLDLYRENPNDPLFANSNPLETTYVAVVLENSAPTTAWELTTHPHEPGLDDADQWDLIEQAGGEFGRYGPPVILSYGWTDEHSHVVAPVLAAIVDGWNMVRVSCRDRRPLNRPGFAGGSFTWFQRLPGPGSHGSW